MFMYSRGLYYHTAMPFLSHNIVNEQNINPMLYSVASKSFSICILCQPMYSSFAQWLSGIVTTAMCYQVKIVMIRLESLVQNVNFKQCMPVIVKHHVQSLRQKDILQFERKRMSNDLQSMPRVYLVQSLTVAVIANMPSTRDEKDPTYQRDIRYVFKLNKWILGSIGIWPVSIRGIGRYASKIAIALGNLALSFAIVPCALHIVYDEKDIIMRLKLSGLLAFCLVSMIKYCILAIRRPKILRCIEYVKNDWWQATFGSDRELMLKYANLGRNLTIISASFMYTGGIIYYMILIPFFSENKINNRTVRPLVYPTFSKFRQSQISPIYEIVYVVHCMCGYTTYSITAGACGLAAVFVTHACGQIQVIVSRLEALLNGENPNIHQRIAVIVKDHVRIMRFSVVVEEILQEVCLVEFSSSVCTICLLEYYCIVDWQDDNKLSLANYFLLFVSFCFNIYMLCYIGELLIEKSSQIGSMCYMINWYQLSPRSVRSLILIIAMSSHPIKLSAGRMVDLSLTTFGTVLKTSVAYLSFLRTLVM